MSYGHLLVHALKELDKATEGYLERNNIKAVGDTIKGCAVTAAIAGVGSGWLPGVGSIVATTVWVAAIWGMYIKINVDLGIKIKDNVLKMLASAILTNIISSAGAFLLAFAASFVLKFIPGFGTLGGVAVDGVLGYVTVYVSGLLYIKILTNVFEANKSFDFDNVDMASVVKNAVKDVNVKEALNEAKKSFKDAKKNGEFKKK